MTVAISTTAATPHPRVDQIVTGLFREREGYRVWRPAGTNDWLITYTFGGIGRFGFPEGELLTRPGELVLLRPNTPHDYGVEPTRRRWDFLWAHFHPRSDWYDYLGWPEDAPGILRLLPSSAAARRALAVIFRRIHSLATGPLRRREAFAMNALEELLLRCDAANPRSSRLDPRIAAAMDFACRHLAQSLTLEQLAGVAGLSASRFSHLFRRNVSMSPQQFVEQQRLSRAEQLLAVTSRTIKEIAFEVGFENPFYFTLRFKRRTGLSPRAYRARGSAGGSPSVPGL